MKTECAELKFQTLRNDDCDITKMSQKINYGDFDLYYVIQFNYMEEYVAEPEEKYSVSVLAVSPQQAETECRKYLAENMNLNFDEVDEKTKVSALVEYGVYSTLFCEMGNNKKELLKTAKEEATQMNLFSFGFMMDKPQNRIGSTGWDFIKGDIMAGLEKA